MHKSPFNRSITSIREDFPILNTQINQHPLIYLDNAATTQKPLCVIQAVSQLYENYYANVARSSHALGEKVSAAVEDCRLAVAYYIHATHPQEIVFTKNTTESINILAHGMKETLLPINATVLLGEAEHHSNLLPWLHLSQQGFCQVIFAPITPSGNYDWDKIATLIKEHRPRLVCLGIVSNVLGIVEDYRAIISLIHHYGGWIFLDAAQAAGHQPLDVQALDCDFLAFSGHKMLAPSGIGILYGKSALLEKLTPACPGGGAIVDLQNSHPIFKEIPYRLEAGTPNIEGIVGLHRAINYIEDLGRPAIYSYNKTLIAHIANILRSIPEIHILGPPEKELSSILSFTVEGIASHDLGLFLDAHGVAIRTGKHCAHPLFDKLGISDALRLSVALYNTKEELEQLGTYLVQILRQWKI